MKEIQSDHAVSASSTASREARALAGATRRVRTVPSPFEERAPKSVMDREGHLIVASNSEGEVPDGPEGVTDSLHIITLRKYQPDGKPVWTWQLADPTDASIRHAEVNALATDAEGNIAVAGNFSGTVDLGRGPLTS